MKVFRENSFAEVYANSLNELMMNPQYTASPRGMAIKEFQPCTLIVEDPSLCLYNNIRRSSQYKYIAAELIWYFMGRNDVEFIEKYASFWRIISNEDETVNSAYGNLLFNEKNEYGLSQWQWAFQTLKNDKDSRQAIMLFNKPHYQWIGNKDVICTLNAIFNIRDNKLNFSVSMRSNDAILGTPTDVAFFCLLQQQMLKLLKPYYPELELGTYTHTANSYHIYDRHFSLVSEMIENDFIEKSFPDMSWNFINEHGDPTEDRQRLMMEVEADKIGDYSEDPLYGWISEKLH